MVSSTVRGRAGRGMIGTRSRSRRSRTHKSGHPVAPLHLHRERPTGDDPTALARERCHRFVGQLGAAGGGGKISAVRILVTGGAGFIGSHVVDQLLAGGATVRVVDSLDPAVHDTVPDYLHPEVDLLVGDIADPAVAAAAVTGVDAVCHQAAKVGLGVDFGDVGAYVADNDTGTASLLEALWRRSFRGRLVLASSMVVYGEGRYRCEEHGDVRPGPRAPADLDAGRFDPTCPVEGCGRPTTWAAIDESAPMDPRNVYAATKLHQEHLCTLWGREAGATVVALRYHNVYGPRMPRDTPYAGVASIFRSALAAGRAPEVYEDGGQTRDFVHVRDVARANVAALTRPDVEPGAYNIASGSPHTVGDLARALTGAMLVGRGSGTGRHREVAVGGRPPRRRLPGPGGTGSRLRRRGRLRGGHGRVRPRPPAGPGLTGCSPSPFLPTGVGSGRWRPPGSWWRARQGSPSRPPSPPAATSSPPVGASSSAWRCGPGRGRWPWSAPSACRRGWWCRGCCWPRWPSAWPPWPAHPSCPTTSSATPGTAGCRWPGSTPTSTVPGRRSWPGSGSPGCGPTPPAAPSSAARRTAAASTARRCARSTPRSPSSTSPASTGSPASTPTTRRGRCRGWWSTWPWWRCCLWSWGPGAAIGGGSPSTPWRRSRWWRTSTTATSTGWPPCSSWSPSWPPPAAARPGPAP